MDDLSESDGSKTPTETQGLVAGFVVSASGPACITRFPLQTPDDAWLWCHFDRDAAAASGVLDAEGIPDEALTVLLAQQTRPMTRSLGSGILLVGRGLPEDENATPDETVSIRAWLEERRLITASMQPIVAVQRLQRDLASGEAPAGPVDALIRLIGVMTERVAAAVEVLGDRLDELNQGVIDETVVVTTAQIAPLRIRSIVLHRYLVPLKAALVDLQRCRSTWLTSDHIADVHEIVDHVTRVIEDLETAQSRAAVARDEIASQQNESLSRRLYGLTVLTAVFLPLTFVTGALGMNLAGIPFADEPWAFIAAIAASGVIVLGEIWLLKKVGWL